MVRAYSVFEDVLHRAFRNEGMRANWFRPHSELLDLIRRLKEPATPRLAKPDSTVENNMNFRSR
jgi:hypothetical protein